MVTISETDLESQFGSYKALALREPVSITSDGAETLVMLSADEFKRLKALDDRRSLYAWELPDDLAAALETATPPAFTSQYDIELNE